MIVIFLLIVSHTFSIFPQSITFENNLSYEENSWSFPKLNTAPRDFLASKNLKIPSESFLLIHTDSLLRMQYIQSPDGGKIWIFEDGGYIWDLISGCKLEVWTNKTWKYSCKSYIAEKILQGNYGYEIRITFPDLTQSIQRISQNGCSYNCHLYDYSYNYSQGIY